MSASNPVLGVASRSARLALVAFAALALSACGFNSVPTKQEEAKAKWADVQAAFQERANLVPNLAAVVKGAATNEKDILTGVTEARAKATSIQISAEDLDDPAKMEQFKAAQEELGRGIGRLMATVEAYPEVTSTRNYETLQHQLEGTESKVRIALKDYNEAVRDYNTEVRTFPSMIGAKLRGAEPLVPYEAATPGAEVAPNLEGKL